MKIFNLKKARKMIFFKTRNLRKPCKIAMKMGYNIDKTVPAEPSLKGNIVPDVKRSENFTSIAWRAQSDSLLGHLPYSSVLQKTENKMVFAKKDTIRIEFLVLPARLVKTQRRNVLKLPSEYISKQTMDYIIQNIRKMKTL
jgi:hypothetical protein